jgi:hypothetical protein
MSKPEDEPLGGKPMLPAPSPEAQRRAHPLFSRILAEQRSERTQEGQAEWRPTPHDDPTRVTNRDSIMIELARRKRERDLHHGMPPAPPLEAADAPPESMSAVATDPYAALPDAFPASDDPDSGVHDVSTRAARGRDMIMHDEPTHSRRAFPPMHFASGRRYDATLAFIQAMAGPLEQTGMVTQYNDAMTYRDTPARPQMAVASTDVDDDELARLARLSEGLPPPPPDDNEEDAPTMVVSRPPPFAPMVRPSPPARKGVEQIDQDTMSAMVDTSMLVTNPDGSAAFEIAFDDEVFQNLACTIAVGPAGIVATFKAPDANTRRLLEAEAGRLRVRLSDKGLRVAEVRVEEG